ncbi:MAG: hypothetical protein WDO13_17625 [Verrucomicrobiota bacterium]
MCRWAGETINSTPLNVGGDGDAPFTSLTPGQVELSDVSLDFNPGGLLQQATSFTIGTVTFTGIGTGTSDLTFDAFTSLSDPERQPDRLRRDRQHDQQRCGPRPSRPRSAWACWPERCSLPSRSPSLRLGVTHPVGCLVIAQPSTARPARKGWA